jgi:predicted SAM-dependent methyltransferase
MIVTKEKMEKIFMFSVSDIPLAEPLRVIIGAGQQAWPGWIATQGDELNLLQSEQWNSAFGERRIDALLCEHVWEHLTEEEGRTAAALCYDFLKPGGYIRCAVPDANFRNQTYQRMVQVGGPGPADHPAADHKIVYDYRLFTNVFTAAGFTVDLLEYCDENGRFHFNYWNPADGPIFRALRSDPRNQDGALGFVSLIIDAVKL